MRNSTEILVWMRRSRPPIKQTRIAKECKKKKTHVWETIHGARNDRVILAWLKDHNCPVEFLDLPEDMRRAA